MGSGGRVSVVEHKAASAFDSIMGANPAENARLLVACAKMIQSRINGDRILGRGGLRIDIAFARDLLDAIERAEKDGTIR